MPAVVYHSTVLRQSENAELCSHIQCNVDSFLQLHPDAIILITGDFNFRSTGLDANHIKRITGLSQIIKVATRADVIIDWCLTNSRDNIFQSIQLPPIGTSDHYTILMKAQDPPSKPDISPIRKRDLSDSSIRPFGRCIASFDWSAIFNIHDCDIKYEKFNDAMSAMIADHAETFNRFLVALTSHFDPLPPDDNMASLEVPSEYLVNTQQVYKKLREIKTTKSPGSDMLPNKILRIFACELAPIITDIYN